MGGCLPGAWLSGRYLCVYMYQINDIGVSFHVTDMWCESVPGLVTCECVQKSLLMAASFCFCVVAGTSLSTVDTKSVSQ